MDTKQTERLANSAKLKFNESDIEFWSENMKSIFTWLDDLSRVDTTAVADDFTAQCMHTREDIAVVSPALENIVSAFSESEDNMAKVKKVL